MEEKRLKGKNEKNDNIVEKILKIHVKSLEEIDNIINSSFNKFQDKMDLEQFTEVTIKKNSEIFLRILFFLYDRMPFSFQNVEAMRAKYNQTKEEDFQKISTNASKRNSLVLPKGKFSEKFKINEFAINEIDKSFGDLTLNDKENKKINEEKVKTTNNNNFLLRKESKSISPELKNNNKPKKENEIKGTIKTIKNFQDKNKFNNLNMNEKKDNIYFKVQDNLLTKLPTINKKEDNKNEIKKEKIKGYILNNKNIKYENWVYKRTKTGKLRKFYLVLINRDIYYYKSEMKTDFVGMHNLTGYYFLDTEERNTIEGKEYFAFKIYNKNK